MILDWTKLYLLDGISRLVCKNRTHYLRALVYSHFSSMYPTNAAGLIEYRANPFWHQKCCHSHEHDGTPSCCSCERMEPVDARFLVLDDGRKLCLECLDSSMMDTHECQPLYLEIQEFYEGLNMKVEQQVPLLLVERQALNEAMEGEKNGHHHMPETKGLCLSEEQTINMHHVTACTPSNPKKGLGRILIMMSPRGVPTRVMKEAITRISLPSGSEKLYSSSKDGTVRVWDCSTGQCVGYAMIGGDVGCLVSKGSWLFAWSQSVVKAWDLQNQTEFSLSGPIGSVSSMVVDDEKVFAGMEDGTIMV